MKQDKWYHILGHYLREHLPSGAIFLGFVAIFAAIFRLYDLETEADSRSEFVGLYGGFFFIGIFLGVLFIMATVLIIYYKQISEGSNDKQRYEIMQKVGMTHQEIKSSIHSQVLTVFFLPLIVAGIHISVAFPIIKKLLALLNLLNVQLFLTCTVVCYAVFAVMYLLIYLLTARTYYKIVSK